MPRRRPRVQAVKRHYVGKCLLCGEADPALLDAHRALEPGGQYHWANILVACSNCHRAIHSGRIAVHGRYLRSDGCHVWHLTMDGAERWIPDARGD